MPPGHQLVFRDRLSADDRCLRQSCRFERCLDRTWEKVCWKWGFFHEFGSHWAGRIFSVDNSFVSWIYARRAFSYS